MDEGKVEANQFTQAAIKTVFEPCPTIFNSITFRSSEETGTSLVGFYSTVLPGRCIIGLVLRNSFLSRAILQIGVCIVYVRKLDAAKKIGPGLSFTLSAI